MRGEISNKKSIFPMDIFGTKKLRENDRNLRQNDAGK